MEWISVKDQLPEKNKPVLVYSNNYGVREDYFVYEIKKGEPWFNGSRDEYDYSVTHWMRLPKPPKL